MEIKLTNCMEVIVRKKVDELNSSLQCCKCQRCLNDILAYVLNRVPPRYVVTTEGELYCKLNTVNAQFETELVTLIIQASQLVDSNPRHE